eukprot:jgi/Mesen1/2023/ME000148S01131
MGLQERKKHMRKRKPVEEDSDGEEEKSVDVRSTLEEVKALQRQRDRVKGMAAEYQGVAAAAPTQAVDPDQEGGEELVLQDTFAQETAVIVEDPNMVKYVEQELARRRGIQVDAKEDATTAEEDLYSIPDHLKVQKRVQDEGTAAWTTGIAEVQLSIDFKLKNIEETEAAKKALQERRPQMGRQRAVAESNLPASFSADYFQRGRDYAEKLRRDHPDLYKDSRGGPGRGGGGPGRGYQGGGGGGGHGGGGGGPGGHRPPGGGEHDRRQAATDEIMLERFRKRERNRMRR